MEMLDSLETADESSGNSGMVKSENESPDHDNGRSSPPPNCAICLGRCRNKSFTDSCLHQFCFKCLLTWSRVKTECPLCKQNFKSIIHNVKSNHQYEEYPVQQPQNEERGPNLDFSDIFNAARRFRYRTTLTLPRRETMAIRQFLLHYPLSALINDLPGRGASRDRARRSPADFRRTVYRHNLWARPLPDFTGRFRDCSPDFFRYNDSQVHRLVPWLSRELFYLLNENGAHVTYVMGRILELLPQLPILSQEFRNELQRYLGDRTQHFLHEFHCFASTPYDITGYDRHVQYHTDERLANVSTLSLVSHVLSSSDSESRDSDIVVVSSSHASEPTVPGPSRESAAPGPSRESAAPGPSREPAAPAAPKPAHPQPAVIPIETISHSDSDSDSEVIVVGYIKPPHQRTPELVDLLASDSDVVVQEPDEPTAAPSEPLVRIKLSSSIIKPRTPPLQPTAPLPSASPIPPATIRRRRAVPYPSFGYQVPSPTEAEYGSDNCADNRSSSSDSFDRTKRTLKKKSRRKSTRGSRSRARADGHESRRSKESKKPTDGDRKTKGKSKNGKDVKSSKAVPSETPVLVESTPELYRAGPSGLETGSRKNRSSEPVPVIDELGPSGSESGSKKKKNSALAPGINEPGPSGLESGSMRKKNSAPVLVIDEPGPNGLETGSKRKKNSAPVSGIDEPDPNGLESDSRKKKNSAPVPVIEEPGPSGLENGSKRKRYDAPALDRPGPSGIDGRWTRKRSIDQVSPPDRDRADSVALAGSSKKICIKPILSRSSRETRQNKRLKSIVNVMKRHTSTSDDSSESRTDPAEGAARSSTKRPKNKSSASETPATRSRSYTSSSDDNIPLRHTLTKQYTLSRTYVSDFSD